MSLTFGGANSDRVNCGSAASLDDLGNGILSVLVWIYPTTLTTSRHIFTKYNKVTTGWSLGIDSTTNTELIFIQFGSTNEVRITNDAPLSTNTWICIAASSNFGTATAIYTGGLTTSLSERTYGGSSSGVTRTSDAAQSLLIGNADRSPTPNSAFQGRIALAMIWNRVLSLEEFKKQQFNPHIIGDDSCKGFWIPGYNGTGTQPDLSGNANNGTVTGATVSDHVSLRPVFGLNRYILPSISTVNLDQIASDDMNNEAENLELIYGHNLNLVGNG